MFIKASFGGGYVLRLRTRRDADFGAIESVVRRARVRDGAAFFRRQHRRARRSENARRDAVATVALPSSARASFPALLEALEGARGEAIGVLECGVGCATLEDAFLNVADRADGARSERTRVSAAASASASEETDARVKTRTPRLIAHTQRHAFDERTNDQRTRPRVVAGNKTTKTVTFLAQTRATFWKRAVHCRMFPSTVAGTLLAPLLFAMAGLAASSAAARRAGDPLPASMLDRSFLGDAPIGVASSSGRHAFVPGTAPAVPADPSDVVAFAGDALALLAEDGAVAPFPAWTACGIARRTRLFWTRARARARRAARTRPPQRPTDTLQTALAEKLAASFSRPQNLSPSASSGSVFDAFASLDGVLRATPSRARRARWASAKRVWRRARACSSSPARWTRRDRSRGTARAASGTPR